MRATFYVILFFLLSPFCFCQNALTDSLLSVLKTDKEDTLKVNHLNKLCNEYRLTGNYKNGLNYGSEALALSEKLNFKKGIANSHTNIGMVYNYLGNYPEALKNYFSALKLREETGDKPGISISYNNIGITYDNQGDFENALKNYFAALKLRIELNDKLGIAYLYNNIGVSYFEQADVMLYQKGFADSAESKLNKALQNYRAAFKIKQELNDKHGIASAYNNIGLFYSQQARVISKYKGSPDSVNKKLVAAVENHLAALKIRETIDDKDGIATSLINLGEVLIQLNKFKEAQIYLSKALQLSKAINNKDDIKTSYLVMTGLDSALGNFKAAFEHHKLFIIYRDSLDNEETKKKTIESTLTYEFEKKELAAKAQQEKLDALTLEEKEKQKIIIYAVAGVLLLVIIFSLFLFNRFKITQRQKNIIEEQKVLVDKAYDSLHEKNKEVMDSIRYAKRIQNALITSERYITRALQKLKK